MPASLARRSCRNFAQLGARWLVGFACVAATAADGPPAAPVPPPPPLPPPKIVNAAPASRPSAPTPAATSIARPATNQIKPPTLDTPLPGILPFYTPPTAAGAVDRPSPLAPPAQTIQPPLRQAPLRSPTPQPRILEPFPLVFDADSKELEAKPGDTNLVFRFAFTNTSPGEVTLDRIQTSCGCTTTTNMPPLPWHLASGTNGSFEVVFDTRGKRGKVQKAVYVFTSKGFKAVTVRAILPENGMSSPDRLRNMQIAAADRQAVFKGDCVRCHAFPGKGRLGRDLFQAVCGVCHEAEHRAEMVPDLRVRRHGSGPDYWRQWISHGKLGTLMPAFATSEGGTLSDAQIESLVEYLNQRYPTAALPAEPATNAPAPAIPTTPARPLAPGARTP